VKSTGGSWGTVKNDCSMELHNT
jgi:hypothetical protein